MDSLIKLLMKASNLSLLLATVLLLSGVIAAGTFVRLRSVAVKSHATVQIRAPRDRVWQLMTAFEGWPRWNRAVDAIVHEGGVKPGAKFVWKASGLTVTSTLKEVVPTTFISWTGVTIGTHAYHTWEFSEETNGVVTVTTTESLEGWLPWLMTATMQKTIDESMRAGLDSLKAAAEAGH